MFIGRIPPSVGIEILYSFVIIVCSLMVYLSTGELYKISKHQGIKYFRLAFLFFAISYFFRSFIRVIAMILPEIFRTCGIFCNYSTLFLFTYTSAMGVFYLLYSVMWKKWEKKNFRIYLLHGIAILLSLIIIINGTLQIYLLVNLFLLLLVLFVVYTSRAESKKAKYNLYFVYVAFLIFWIVNIFDVLVPSFLEVYKLGIYLVSSGLFLLILYKVLRKTG